jgi:Family of unknown function (DUF6519)/Right handed beta helix region
MAADFSRVRTNPLLDYAGVELKQGGVLLDADANELVGILDRRLRALAGDVLGRATVGANTPDAFRISLAGSGGLQIGLGRLYVDGLLAENHGAADRGQRVFDELMAEPRFSAPIPYDAQPYLPDPPALPEAGRHLVYLDVWNREVTQLEQPGLVEQAVGVETSSRVQTVWQVRVLADEAGSSASCGSPDANLAGWSDSIAPSTGRLTTGTYEVAAVTDPCELPPTGGYRGLENQLYRVEIHKAGQPGGDATFKWSRENASVGSRVGSCLSATVLELESLGRDDVSRFNTGDWVEIVDDVRELSQAPGEIRKISVEEATRRITLSSALPAEMLPTSFPDSAFPKARNLRVRRWDQKGQVLSASGGGATAVFQDLDASGSTGLIKVPAAGETLLLENGVTVSFTSAGAKGFRAGDYWVFAARTADASVELLDEAPPRGIHHHYARLALWDAGTTAEPTDCRHSWPPAGGADCGCAQCVTPESHASGQLTIEEAVRRVQETGGTVCLHTGQYVLRAPVRLTSARSVRIKGQGPATVIATPGSAFSIESSLAIAIENLAVISLGKQPAISVRSGAGIALQELVLLVPGGPDAHSAGVALSGVIAGLIIRDNLIVAPEGIRAVDPTAPEALKFLIAAAMRVEDNILWCQRQAIDFAGLVGHLFASRVCGNELLGCRDGGIGVLGFALPGASMHIENNSLNVNGPGIRCAVDGAWITNNKLTAVARGDVQATGSGISLLIGFDPNGSDQCQLLANQISGFPDAGILVNAPALDLIIKLNIIEKCGNGIVMLDAATAASLSIENNHLRDIGTARAQPPLGSFVIGIGVTRTEAATIVGNTLRRIGLQAARGIALVAGVVHFAVRSSRTLSNEIVEVGPVTELPGATQAGILLQAPYLQNEICDNHVERDSKPAQADAALWSAVTADEPDEKRPIIRAGIFTAVRLTESRTLAVNGVRAFIDEATVDLNDAGAATPRGSSAAVRGNVLAARGSAPAVSVIARGDIRFGDNRCELIGRNTAVLLRSSAAIVSSNLLRGGASSLAVSTAIERVTVLGNATSGAITVDQRSLAGTPWEPLNVRI